MRNRRRRKAIKAVLVQRSVEFPKTHDIAKLLTLVGEAGVPVAADIRAAAALTPFAAGGRYPRHWVDVTDSEYVEAVGLAERVVRWAESVISVR